MSGMKESMKSCNHASDYHYFTNAKRFFFFFLTYTHFSRAALAIHNEHFNFVLTTVSCLVVSDCDFYFLFEGRHFFFFLDFF